MTTVKYILGTAVLFTLSVWTEAGVVRNSTDPQHEMTVSERLELVNKDLGGDILTGHGDGGAFGRVRRNADPCVKKTCKWPRSRDGAVYVPYVLDNRYSASAKYVIEYAMWTFSQSTCIRFTPRNYERNYLNIKSLEGCRSHVGRKGKAQVLELKEPDCINHGTIQHELLHALGFHHEQSRSDRDNHIRVLWENIPIEQRHNFRKLDTLNQRTGYDYNSVMHYSRFAGSSNGLPTLEAVPFTVPFPESCPVPFSVPFPVPFPVPFGKATEMSQTDIYRVNLLYCT